MDYVLIRKKGQKTIRLTVDKGGKPIVTCGGDVPVKTIDEFVASKVKWLERQRAQARRASEYLREHAYAIGCKFAYLGEELEITPSNSERVYIAGGKIYLPKGRDIHSTLEEYERSLAKEGLARIYAAETERLGIEESPELVIKRFIRRLGCYDRKKHEIMLNSRLIRCKERSIRAVICHELTHIEHHDHSKAFYAALEKAFPEYKRAIEELCDTMPTSE